MSKLYLDYVQNIFKIHSVLKETHDSHHLHNIYQPLGTMGEKKM